VTWNQTNLSRNVVHDVTVERLSDHKKVDSSGDRTQTPLDGGFTTGITVTGTRSWTSTSGTWDLLIDNVQMRWIDPVPQSTVAAAFRRISADNGSRMAA
jgi:hypothetical protein